MTLIISLIWSFPDNRTNLNVAFLRFILSGVTYSLVDVIICLSLCTLFSAQGRYLEKVNLLALVTDDRRLTTEVERISQLLTQQNFSEEEEEDVVIDNQSQAQSEANNSRD